MPPLNPLTLILRAREAQTKDDYAGAAAAVKEIISQRAPSAAWVPLTNACVDLAKWTHWPDMGLAPKENPEYADLAEQAKKFRTGCLADYDRLVEHYIHQLPRPQAKPNVLQAFAHLDAARKMFEPLKKFEVSFWIHCRQILKDIKVNKPFTEKHIEQLRVQRPMGNALRVLARLDIARERFETRKKVRITFLIQGGKILDEAKDIRVDLD